VAVQNVLALLRRIASHAGAQLGTGVLADAAGTLNNFSRLVLSQWLVHRLFFTIVNTAVNDVIIRLSRSGTSQIRQLMQNPDLYREKLEGKQFLLGRFELSLN